MNPSQKRRSRPLEQIAGWLGRDGGSARPRESARLNNALGDRAFASIEFAIIVGAVLLLMLAGADLTFYLRDKMRLDRVASGLGLVLSSYTELYDNDFPGLFQASKTMAGESLKVDGKDGATIVTGIVNSAGTPKIAWRQQTAGSAFTSQFGAVNDAPANLPDNYAVPTGQSVIAVEVYTSASPWVLSKNLMDVLGSQSLRSYALFQPRAALLGTINPGGRP